jgi:hypothetical protein
MRRRRLLGSGGLIVITAAAAATAARAIDEVPGTVNNTCVLACEEREEPGGEIETAVWASRARVDNLSRGRLAIVCHADHFITVLAGVGVSKRLLVKGHNEVGVGIPSTASTLAGGIESPSGVAVPLL